MARSGERFWVTRPTCRTTSGRRGSAWLTRFCVWTCAMSRFVPRRKVTVIEKLPSPVADEFRYSASSTPLICCSSGVMTVSAIVVGDAPGYRPLTTTVGGTTCGNSLTGRSGSETSPATTMMIETTDAKIGRSMKKDEMFMEAESPSRGRRRHTGTDGHLFGRDLRSRPHPLQSIDDDDVAGFEAFANDAQTLLGTPELNRTVLNLVARTEHENIVLRLIGADRPFLDQYGLVLAAAEQLHARKQTGCEHPLLVVEHSACADRAGARVDLVVHEIHVAFVRKSILVRKPDVHGIRDVAGARALAGARQRLIVQIGVLIAFEVHVDGIGGDDRGEQRSAVVAAGDEVATGDFRATGTPVYRRLHF